ncbi:MAG TPA: dienelactone hydrolase family protein [Bradyrhizobium sp.]|jgi:dienelactone hydrolase|nr:dienelactone hydrolase family protein [Bradyrhizobium sp.]
MTLDYSDGVAELKGILLGNQSRAGQRPGIVLFPDARGIGHHAIECAERLNALGFVVLVADLYGGGHTAPDVAQARELMSELRSDVARWRARAEAARHALAQLEIVDPARMAAIGYCFGGTTALELARSGAPLRAVVTFHGGLASPRPADNSNIKAKLLICHGAADKLVPLTQLAGFADAMAATNVDWQVQIYGGAEHGFTNPEADDPEIPDHAYHAAADARSWAAMLSLFEEVLGMPKRRNFG